MPILEQYRNRFDYRRISHFNICDFENFYQNTLGYLFKTLLYFWLLLFIYFYAVFYFLKKLFRDLYLIRISLFKSTHISVEQ